MHMKKIAVFKLALAAVLITSVMGCKKIFDIKPEDQLDVSQAYQNVYDADAAVVGIYGKFMKLADRYIILNELRGDLLDVTNNADEYLRQVSTHTVAANNPYVSPRPFYELIINCNDALKHFTIMFKEKRMTEDEYYQRYSDIGALRSFIYLQLGIHYGEVPYVTSALENLDALRDISAFPRLSFNVLLDSLVNFTEALPFKNVYPAGTNLNITVDGYPTEKFFINKQCLLGDLYLWKNDYIKAAEYYRKVMELATQGAAGENYYSQYKLGWAGGFNHYVSYSRAGDASTLVYNDGWRIMFESAWASDGFRREWIWVLPFDNKFQPENNLIKLFSPIGGNYLVRPSQEVMEMWESEQQVPAQGTPGIPYDARGRLSWRQIGGQPVVMKFLYNYINYVTNLPANQLVKDGKWFLYRQTHLHARFAEAANRAGRHRLSWGLLNNGIAGAYPAPTSNVTDYHNTLWDATPFNFDARNSGGSGVPYYRADWYRNIGIRARANLVTLAIPAADSLNSIESALIRETALENAFEGTRWADLLRVAMRRNDPAFIADRVYNKLIKSGISSGAASSARAKLMAKDWYLPFKW
ncbi:MAG: RagB/SusD family protein [Chitinophagaceae bacterium]|nr:RagB/SusD family protein [Chitinophagaceae bacterium]